MGSDRAGMGSYLTASEEGEVDVFMDATKGAVGHGGEGSKFS